MTQGRGAQPVALGFAAAGPGWSDGRQLRPDGLGQLAFA